MADLLQIDSVKIEALCEQFYNDVQPVLQAQGRNHVAPVATYIYEMATTRKRNKPATLAEKIINYSRNGRDVARKFWASDLRVKYQEQAVAKVAIAVQYYRDRAALEPHELAALNKMIKSRA